MIHPDPPDEVRPDAPSAPAARGAAGGDESARVLSRLHRSEALHQALIENVPDTAVFLLDRDLRVLVAHGEAVRRIPSFRDGLHVGRLITDVCEPFAEGLPAASVEHYRAAFDGESRDFEFATVGRTFTMRVVPVPDDSGAVEAALVMVTDVTWPRRVRSQLARRASQQESVARLGELALRDRDLGALIDHVVGAVAEQLGMEFSGLLEFSASRDALHMVAGRGWDPGLMGAQWIKVDQESQAGYTLNSSRPVIVDDLRTERRFRPSPQFVEAGVVSGISVVVEGREQPFGVLGAHSRSPRELSADDVNFLTAVAHLVAVAVERQRDEQSNLHAALHDPLTGLPNRTLVLDRLEHALARRNREGTEVAALMLDLDGFKVINDSLGHAAGDELLLAMAPRLRAAVRPGDTVGRLGGDEFVAVCELSSSPEEAARIADRMASAVSEPLVTGSGHHYLTASVGIAIAMGGSDTPGSLLRDADAAMFRAKERGRGRCELFDDTMREQVVARLRIEAELRQALARDELRVHFQPIVDVHDARPSGVEALVRWEHPQRGLIPPGEFIGVAEETGIITQLGQWVLEAACRQVAAWQAELGIPLRLSVNVSGRQIADPRFAAQAAATARRHGLEPGTLALEITESVLIGESEASASVLSSFREHGLRLELDDFGTGYSSLSYLKRFPLDGIKIDRSFLDGIADDPRSQAIVEAVIHMASALGVDVVTEGVETEDQLATLLTLGCRQAQGYLFSPPVPGDAMGRRLAL